MLAASVANPRGTRSETLVTPGTPSAMLANRRFDFDREGAGFAARDGLAGAGFQHERDLQVVQAGEQLGARVVLA